MHLTCCISDLINTQNRILVESLDITGSSDALYKTRELINDQALQGWIYFKKYNNPKT